MGRQADKIFSTFNFGAAAKGEGDPRDDFDTVLGKFDEHFAPKRNVIHERAKFYNRSQQAEESVKEFLRSLRELAATCDFCDREEESIRDRIVLGLQDSDVSQKLQLEAELDLKSAVDTAHHYEFVKTIKTLITTAPTLCFLWAKQANSGQLRRQFLRDWRCSSSGAERQWYATSRLLFENTV